MWGMFGGLLKFSVKIWFCAGSRDGDLEDDGVSCGDCIESGTECTPDREIPWPHNKDYSKWFLSNTTFIEFECHPHRHILVLCPFINL